MLVRSHSYGIEPPFKSEMSQSFPVHKEENNTAFFVGLYGNLVSMIKNTSLEPYGSSLIHATRLRK